MRLWMALWRPLRRNTPRSEKCGYLGGDANGIALPRGVGCWCNPGWFESSEALALDARLFHGGCRDPRF